MLKFDYQNILAGSNDKSTTDILDQINSTHVDSLDVSYNALGTTGIIKLKDVISNTTKINLYNTGLSSESIKHLNLNPDIVELNVSCNLLMDDGASLLADILKFCEKLTKLELSSCRITSKGIKNICDVLYDKPLTHLNISDNNVDVNDIDKLFKIKTLKHLDISDTDISNDEVENIIASSRSSNVEELKVSMDDE